MRSSDKALSICSRRGDEAFSTLARRDGTAFRKVRSEIRWASWCAIRRDGSVEADAASWEKRARPLIEALALAGTGRRAGGAELAAAGRRGANKRETTLSRSSDFKLCEGERERLCQVRTSLSSEGWTDSRLERLAHGAETFLRVDQLFHLRVAGEINARASQSAHVRRESSEVNPGERKRINSAYDIEPPVEGDSVSQRAQNIGSKLEKKEDMVCQSFRLAGGGGICEL